MIKFYDIEAINMDIIDALCEASDKIIRSGNYVFGTEPFEEDFAEWNGNKHCIGVSSGTSALHMALLALGIGPGDEVITVSHTFRATVSAIRYCGATPVYVDIDPDTYCMDAKQISSKITNNTKAILPVHIYGNVCDMDAICRIANSHNIPVVEDCSQAHGSTLNKKKVGTFGKIGTFSFYPGKGLGALGDAGCIVTDDDDIAEHLKELRSWDSTTIGYNYRLSNLQAEFLRIKLKNYNNILKQKRSIAEIYNEHFTHCHTRKGVQHSYHIYPILVNDRNTVRKETNDKVATGIHYPIPVHKFHSHKTGVHLPVTERIANTQLSLPIYPGVNAMKVIDVLGQYA